MILNTVNKSPFSHNTLKECLSVSENKCSVLLIEDGVLAGKAGALEDVFAANPQVNFYALKADIEARGIADSYSPSVTIIDDAEFVNLVVQHKTVQSWY